MNEKGDKTFDLKVSAIIGLVLGSVMLLVAHFRYPEFSFSFDLLIAVTAAIGIGGFAMLTTLSAKQ